MKILGTHSGHDASACLIDENTLICAIAKERLTRIKHDSGNPRCCIDYIFEATGLGVNDIDVVAPSLWHDTTEDSLKHYAAFKNVWPTFEHHLLHAHCAVLTAAKTPCLVLVSDGRGCRPEDHGLHIEIPGFDPHRYEYEYETESVYLYDGISFTALEKRYSMHTPKKYWWGSHVDSLGYAYAAVSKIIFGSSFAAGKVMALAAFGQKSSIPEPFIYDDQKFTINDAWLDTLQELKSSISWESQIAKDLALSVQNGLENYLRFRVLDLKIKYNILHFCFGGGVALNCKANALLANLPEVASFRVFNACGDDGLSWGAALHCQHYLKASHAKLNWGIAPGKKYSSPPSNIDTLAQNIAKLLAHGEIVGIFQGGAEFGPRALGHRSILASPATFAMRDKLNLHIKQREEFRPFGGIVRKENLQQLSCDQYASNNMLSAFSINPSWAGKIPAVMHEDGTSRLQLIDAKSQLLYRISKQFQRITGLPVILNTSLNAHGEPIVETPQLARETSKRIGLRYIVINDKIISL